VGELPPQGELQAPGEDDQEAEEAVEIGEEAHQPVGVEPIAGGHIPRPANAVQPGYLTLGATRKTLLVRQGHRGEEIVRFLRTSFSGSISVDVEMEGRPRGFRIRPGRTLTITTIPEGDRIVLDLPRLQFQIPQEVYDYIVNPHRITFMWREYDRVLWHEAVSNNMQRRMLCSSNVVNFLDLCTEIAGNIYYAANAPGVSIWKRQGLRGIVTTLLEWMEAMSIPEYRRRSFRKELKDRLYEDWVNQDKPGNTREAIWGEEEPKPLLECIRKELALIYVMMELAAMYPAMPAPMYDLMGQASLEQFFELVMRAASMASSGAMMRWGAGPWFRPNEDMIRVHNRDRVQYRQALSDLEDILAADFQEELVNHHRGRFS